MLLIETLHSWEKFTFLNRDFFNIRIRRRGVHNFGIRIRNTGIMIPPNQCCVSGSGSGSVRSVFFASHDPDQGPLVRGIDPDPSIYKQK
jgi:hypothetical protein